MPVYDALIVANGEIPSLDLWKDLPYRILISTDGAANFLQQHALTPNIIIGDMDSIADLHQNATPKEIQKLFPESRIIFDPDPDKTDFEKALNFAEQNNYKDILCIGVLGKSADHMLYNFSCLLRTKNLNWLILHQYNHTLQWIFPLAEKTSIYTQTNNIISFFPFPTAKLSTEGLKWELNQAQVAQGDFNSIRNITTQEEIQIACDGKCLCFLTSFSKPILHFL